MGLEGAGEGSHESGGSSGSSAGGGGDRGGSEGGARGLGAKSERGLGSGFGLESNASTPDPNAGKTGSLSSEASGKGVSVSRDLSVSQTSETKEVRKGGLVNAFIGFLNGLFSKGPAGAVAGAVSGYANTPKESVTTDTTDLGGSFFGGSDSSGNDRESIGALGPNDGADHDFFAHNRELVSASEQNKSVANVIMNPYIDVLPIDPNNPVNSLGPITSYANSGDASTISPSSPLSVSESDDSWLLIAAAAMLFL